MEEEDIQIITEILDGEIATKVMEWEPSHPKMGYDEQCWVKWDSQAGPDGGYCWQAPEFWSPLTRLDHAMQVVELFRKKATQRAIISISGRYCWSIAGVSAIEDTLPLAICKAALKFLEEQKMGLGKPDFVQRR